LIIVVAATPNPDPLAALAGQAFCTPVEAAAVLRVDPRTIRFKVGSGEIPATRIGVRILIPVAWLRSQAMTGQNGPAS
jgi:excisionase family DNA binding protein